MVSALLLVSFGVTVGCLVVIKSHQPLQLFGLFWVSSCVHKRFLQDLPWPGTAPGPELQIRECDIPWQIVLMERVLLSWKAAGSCDRHSWEPGVCPVL